MKTTCSFVPVLASICATASTVLSAQSLVRPATPRDPIVAIAEAFTTHQLVAVGDNHGNVEGHAFRLALIRDARLAGVLNDIVVEFGNSRHQDLIDRFIRGDAVADADLRHVWQDTTQVEEAWDLPIYEEFFRAVRTVNASRPRRQHFRVLLGDPPIDWTMVRTADDLKPWMDRDGHAVDVIRREVLSRKRRGLIIYGDQHLLRRNTDLGAADEWAAGLVAQLEKAALTRVFNVYTDTRLDTAEIQADIATWPRPSLAMLSGTTLGQTVMAPGPKRKPVRMEEQFDAFLYLGPPAAMTIAELPPALCADASYISMRSSRLMLLPAPPDAPFNPADRLKARCAFPKGDLDIVDGDAAFTGLVRATLLDAQKGQAHPERFSPDLRPRLVLFVQRYGPRLLGPMGELNALTLIGEATIAGQRLRRYRAVFTKGRTVWTVGVSPEGTISSMDPRREPERPCRREHRTARQPQNSPSVISRAPARSEHTGQPGTEQQERRGFRHRRRIHRGRKGRQIEGETE